MEYVITRKDDELQHHGIKGQKWGIRRYQKKDGSLTVLGRHRYKTDKEFKKTIDRQKALEKARAAKEAKKTEAEKKAEILKSVDPEVLYKNKDLLTTQELNDRILRIDTEARLAAKIPEKKTGMDAVNDKMNKVANTLNNATNMLQKVDNAYSTVAKSSIGKTLAKQLGLETPKKEFDYADFVKNINKKSNQEVADAAKRAINESLLKKNVKDLQNAAGGSDSSKTSGDNSSSTKSVDSGSSGSSSSSNPSNNATNNSGNSSGSSAKASSKTETWTGTVEGEGTSRFTGWKSDNRGYEDATWRDVSTNSTEYSNQARIGQSYVNSFLLEDKSKK